MVTKLGASAAIELMPPCNVCPAVLICSLGCQGHTTCFKACIASYKLATAMHGRVWDWAKTLDAS